MAFSDNLQYLRKQRQITQEQLAEKLEVSRQSVSKWESGGAYPETEKLLLLCDLFSCTMDALLRGDVKTGCEQAGQEYDRHMDRFSGMIALGVGLAFLGVVLLLFLHGIGVSDPLPIMVFLAVVVVSVMLFVVGGLQHSLFLKRTPKPTKSIPRRKQSASKSGLSSW